MRDIGNVLRHEYQDIVDQIIWQTVTVELPKLQAALLKIKAELAGDKP